MQLVTPSGHRVAVKVSFVKVKSVLVVLLNVVVKLGVLVRTVVVIVIIPLFPVGDVVEIKLKSTTKFHAIAYNETARRKKLAQE